MRIKQFVIDKYGSREQLIQQGIWRGELYSSNVINDSNRGWVWRTVVLYDEDGEDKLQLDSVPIITDMNESELIGVGKVSELKKGGIRRLTPVQTVKHPLANSSHDDDDMVENVSLSETLSIIDLDLSRLLLNDIFQDPLVHSQLRRVLYNYMVQLQSTNYSNKNYQQGFHEILGTIYLQLYRDKVTQLVGESAQEKTMIDSYLIYKKLMAQVIPTFYSKKQLIEWEHNKFEKILKICSPVIFNVLCNRNDDFNNLIWLLRWTRLLFIRELPTNYSMIIWDHIITFQYATDTFIACVIITLLLNIIEDLNGVNEIDEIIEILLHYQENVGSRLIDSVEVCKIAGNLSELFAYANYDDMKNISDTFIKVRLGEDKYQHLTKIASVQDPNRTKMESILKRRVRKLTRFNK